MNDCNDKSKAIIWKSLIFNNRLEIYKEYIKFAQKSGYSVISLEKFYRLSDRRNEKHFILRHDVDWAEIATRRMLEIEKACGVTSTYYFRFSTIDKQLIDEMISAGFDVGFHFETIADYILETDCDNKEEINIEEMRCWLKNDVAKFEEKIGHKIVSCCSHGHPINSKLGTSNNVITEDADMRDIGLLFEAYEREMYERDIDCHIMDGGMLKNYGFQYKDNPFDAIKNGYQNILFLSHPHNWCWTPKNRIILLSALARGKANYSTERVFKRITE